MHAGLAAVSLGRLQFEGLLSAFRPRGARSRTSDACRQRASQIDSLNGPPASSRPRRLDYPSRLSLRYVYRDASDRLWMTRYRNRKFVVELCPPAGGQIERNLGLDGFAGFHDLTLHPR
jgi:hypothetical protein